MPAFRLGVPPSFLFLITYLSPIKPPCASLFSPWTSHRILEIRPVSEILVTLKNYHLYCHSGGYQIYTIITPDQQSRSIKVVNANASIANETKTRSKRRMKSTVSGTDDQGGRDVSQPSSSSEAKFDTYPITTPPRHIIYTTAQLHEKVANKDLGNCLKIGLSLQQDRFTTCFKTCGINYFFKGWPVFS